MAQCTGETKSGNRCHQKAAVDNDRCHRHDRGRATAHLGNVAAIGVTIKALESDQSDVDAALAEAARSIAAALDENPTNANLWGRYLDAISLLMAGDELDDEVAALFDQYASGGS